LRSLAGAGDHPVGLYNQWHQSLRLQPLEKFLLPLLDGSADAGALVDAVSQAVEQGAMHVTRGGEPLTEAGEISRTVREQVDAALRSLALNALLDSMPALAAHPVTPEAPSAGVENGTAAGRGKSRPTKADATPAAKSAKPPRGKK